MKVRIDFSPWIVGVLSLALTAFVAGARAQATAPAENAAEPLANVDGSAPSDEQLAAWIAELDSNRYRVREDATQQLLSAGIMALEPLFAAANSDRPEPADRAIWILRQLARTDNLEARQQVLERLVRLADRPTVVAEARTALGELRHDFAVRAIEQLGGTYREAGPDEHWGQQMSNRVILDDRWHGGDAGLEQFAGLHNVPRVIVVGTDITADGFARLATVESLQFLQLYGTRLGDEEVAELQQKLPGVEIDYRRGGFLGVEGTSNQQVAIVKSVRPNTAAADAGVQPGDIIRQFNGEQVGDFVDLTDKIRRHNPGDEIKLEVLRGGQTLQISVRLGRWQAS